LVDMNGKHDYAIHWATEYVHLEVANFLLEGASIRAKNDEALRRAASSGYVEVVKFLVKKGANIHAESNEAFRWARAAAHLNVVDFLKKTCEESHENCSNRWKE
jgi:ankyrin repeat protein